MSEEMKLTDEQINEVSNTVEETFKDSPTDKAMKEASTEEASKKLESETVNIITNPITGKPMVVEEDEDDDWLNSGPNTLDELLADDSIQVDNIDPDRIVIKEDSVKTIVETTFGQCKLNIADVTMIINACNRVKKGETFPYFNAMPEVLQKEIRSLIGSGMGTKMGSFEREGKNFIAKGLIDEIINNEFLDITSSDLQKNIASITSQAIEDIKKDDFWGSRRKFFFEYLPKKIDEYRKKGNTEKAMLSDNIRLSFQASYSYADMLDTFMHTGKLRIKKIQLEKYTKTFQEFNFKYARSTNVIQDINNVLPALKRVAQDCYSEETLIKFICIFIAYTNYKHMDPNNLVDHVFMYYFIINIITIDNYNPNNEEDVEFRTQLINNINNFLKVIEEKK